MPSTPPPSILLLGNYPPPYGGVPRHFEYLAPFLVQAGWRVTILSSGETGSFQHGNLTVCKPTRWQRHHARLTSWLLQRRPQHPAFNHLRQTSPSDWLRYVLYSEIGRDLITQHQVNLISAYNMYSYAPVGAHLAEQFNLPLVVTNFGEFFSHKHFFEKNPALAQYVCECSTKLLAMSQHCANSYAEIGLHPSVDVIRYGGDTALFKPSNDGSVIRQRFGLTAADTVVLFIGRLNADMGVETLLASIRRLAPIMPHIKFIVAGEKGNSLPALTTLAEHYPNQVYYSTSVPFAELPLFYAAASIIVAPTQGARACGSLAAIEAMSTGKPVIAAKVGGIPEIVTDGVTGKLVQPDDAQALATGIAELCRLPTTTLAQLGMAGRKRVEQEYNETKLDAQFETLFRSLITPLKN
jgi:glycosyltransferase involved in cell wall biosynthesis